MRDFNEAAVRLGLALYRKSVLEGTAFYSVYDLVFDDSDENMPKSLFRRMFSTKENFWSIQAEAAIVLAGAGLAQSQRRQVPGSAGSDYWLRITPLGKTIYSLAQLQSGSGTDQIDGVGIEDVAEVLSGEDTSSLLAGDLRKVEVDIAKLELSNFQKSSVNSYIMMLSVICEMPERDVNLFWTILSRLNQFAGVASLIVALIALRLAR